jgi:hypothetical protein
MDPSDYNFILGFGLAGYRSFGSELQRIGRCRKLPELTRSSTWNLQDLEKFRTNHPMQTAATVSLNHDDVGNPGLRQAAVAKGFERQLKAFVESIRKFSLLAQNFAPRPRSRFSMFSIRSTTTRRRTIWLRCSRCFAHSLLDLLRSVISIALKSNSDQMRPLAVLDA